MALRLPRELSPCEGEMNIEVEGERWIVSPVKPKKWPENFFENVRIQENSFTRPEQGAHREIV